MVAPHGGSMKIKLLAKFFSLCAASALSTQVLATEMPVNLTKIINEAQSKYQNAIKDYPILIFNQDEIDARFLAANAFGDSKEKKAQRLKVIQEYIFDKIGLEVSEREADQYEPYVTVLKGSAVALPLLQGRFGKYKYKMCGVFHASPNSNQRLELERILGLRTKEVYENQAAESILPKLPYETLAKFSIYHEIGHCLDQTFLPGVYNSGVESPHSVHESESFAEVMGLFILTQQGHKNIARNRGMLRTIYSRKMGSYFAKNPGLGFGNPFFVAGGVIYYLDPVLKAADVKIRELRSDFHQLQLPELITLAREIVEKNALHSRSFHAILSFLQADHQEDALDRYREYSYSSPDLFYESYRDLLTYSDFTSFLMGKIFDEDATESQGQGQLSEIDSRELCTLVVTKQSEALRLRLDSYREELQNELGSPEEQRSLAKRLNDIFEKELSECESVH